MNPRDLANAPSKTATKIADAAYPSGAQLICHKCGRSFNATRVQVAHYFSRGWPKCCDLTMTANPMRRDGESNG